MNHLQRLFFCFRERQRPNALSLSLLARIPLDVLLCIIDRLLLIPESAVAFSLTCRHFKNLLGPRCCQKLGSSNKNTQALLDLLALDLPNFVACSPCKRLHSMENIDRYNSANYGSGTTIREFHSLRTPACVNQDMDNCTSNISLLFGSTAFKMAMKRYHQQPQCTKLLDIMSNKEAKTKVREYYVWQCIEECRIIQGRLFHRQQSVYISLKSRSMTITYLRRNPPSEMICQHINLEETVVEPQTTDSRVTRCQKCRTEFRVDLKYGEGYGLAVFLSKWKDLGPGPESKEWVQHFGTPLGAHLYRRSQAHANNGPQKIEIACLFGDGEDFKFDSWLTPKNKATLLWFQKRYWIKPK